MPKTQTTQTTMTEAVPDFSEEEVEQMLNNLDSFTDEEVIEINRIVDELEIRRKNKEAYDDLIEFCKRMQRSKRRLHEPVLSVCLRFLSHRRYLSRVKSLLLPPANSRKTTRRPSFPPLSA